MSRQINNDQYEDYEVFKGCHTVCSQKLPQQFRQQTINQTSVARDPSPCGLL